MRAPERGHHDALHLLVLAVEPFSVQPCVRGVEDPSLAVAFPDPLHQVHGGVLLLRVLQRHDWPPPGGDLEGDDAEAVDVGARAGAATEHALRVHVAHGASERSRVRLALVVDQPREPEVAELGVEGGVEHNVAGLDVTVQDALLPLLMQVQECRTDSKHDLMPNDEITRQKLINMHLLLEIAEH